MSIDAYNQANHSIKFNLGSALESSGDLALHVEKPDSGTTSLIYRAVRDVDHNDVGEQAVAEHFAAESMVKAADKVDIVDAVGAEATGPAPRGQRPARY